MAVYRVSTGTHVICSLRCEVEESWFMRRLRVGRYICMQYGALGQSALRCRVAGKNVHHVVYSCKLGRWSV